jgi:RNA polymerase sigma-70 factor (ECF subfamily)
MPPTDEQLLIQFKQGDARALHSLIERYTTPIYNLARRLLRDSMEAENVAQETFLRLMLSANRIDLTQPIKPYIFRIAVNQCRDLMRKHRPLVFTDLGDDSAQAVDTIVDDQPEPWESLAQAELETRLRHAIDQLPAKFQTVILLRYFEDLSYEDIARALDLPLNTVRTFLRRAKAQLREALEPESQSSPAAKEGGM